MLGKKIRLERIMDRNTRRTVIVPMDHGMTVGPIPGLVQIPPAANLIAEGGANAAVVHRGAAMFGHRGYGKDIGLILDLASSSTPIVWIAQAHERYGVPVAAGVTAVMATDYYPFLQTKELIGLLNGMKGAAEYEKLVNHPGYGMGGMVAQSVSQFLIIALVIFGNIVYFISRRRQRRLAGTGG